MIRRHHLVEFKRIKELALSTLSSPHHGHRSRDSSSHPDGITVHPPSQREFCNTFPPKADKEQTCRHVRLVPMRPNAAQNSRLHRSREFKRLQVQAESPIVKVGKMM